MPRSSNYFFAWFNLGGGSSSRSSGFGGSRSASPSRGATTAP